MINLIVRLLTLKSFKYQIDCPLGACYSKMNYQIVFILFIALGGCHIAEGLKGIHVIQRNNGFLRLPPDAVVPIDIPDLWFDQVLDHFNPSNPVIWKQVGNHFASYASSSFVSNEINRFTNSK